MLSLVYFVDDECSLFPVVTRFVALSHFLLLLLLLLLCTGNSSFRDFCNGQKKKNFEMLLDQQYQHLPLGSSDDSAPATRRPLPSSRTAAARKWGRLLLLDPVKAGHFAFSCPLRFLAAKGKQTRAKSADRY